MKVIALYKVEQVSKVKSFLRENEGCDFTVVALRADVEACLDKLGISYESGKNLRSINPADNLEYVENMLRGVIDSDELSFWQYQDVPLGKVRKVVLQDYFSIFLYWADIFYQLIQKFSPEEVVVFKTDVKFISRTFLQDEYASVVETAAGLICGRKSISITEIKMDSLVGVWIKRNIFSLKRYFFTAFLRFFNLYISIYRKPRTSRVLISDYWRNTEGYAEYLDDTEFVFYDRNEFFKISWNNIFKFRIRFMNSGVFERFSHKIIAKKESQKLAKYWTGVIEKDLSILELEWKDVSLKPVLNQVLERLICEHSYDDVLSIESISRMLRRLEPDVVVVRASASRQTHFAFLCQVAKKQGIPSVEPQHGLFYLGPCSVPANSTAEHMATYGFLVSEELRGVGFKGKTYDVGSPRFDVYSNLAHSCNKEDKKFTALFVLPDDYTGIWFDTYDIEDILNDILRLSSVNKDLNIILKARAGAQISRFVFELACKKFQDVENVSVVTDESMPSLFSRTDVVVSVMSTVLIEAIAAGIPSIYWGYKGFYASVASAGIKPYKENNGILISQSVSDLEKEIVELQEPEQYEKIKSNVTVFSRKYLSLKGGAGKELAKILLSLKKFSNEKDS